MRNRVQGFTLLEVMVALGILGFIVVASHQILDTSIRSNEISEQTVKELDGLQTTFRLMDQDFSQMVQRLGRNEAGDRVDRFLIAGRNLSDSQFDGIAFIRDGWRNPASLLPRSELQVVSYIVTDDKLIRLYKVYVDTLDGDGLRKHTLLEDVEEFKFQYQGEKDKWLDKWNEKSLPRAIAVEIKLKGYDDVIRRAFLVPGPGVS